MNQACKLAATAFTSLLLAAQTASAAPVTYEVDPVHSGVIFNIRHVVSQVEGRFRKFAGTIQYDAENPANSSVKFTVEADSVFTDNEKRDGHLKSPDFFDVAKYPTLTFESKKVVARSKEKLEVTGTLTIRGVSKAVTIPVTVLGVGAKPGGGEVAGFRADFVVPKKEYGITYGGQMLGDDVDVRLLVEAGKK